MPKILYIGMLKEREIYIFKKKKRDREREAGRHVGR